MQFIHNTYQWLRTHLELLFWITGLTALFFLAENVPGNSLCVFSLVGFGHCPGCGLGHAIHYALHLKLAVSFQSHPLGIFAVLVIFNRIKQLINPVKPKYETKSNHHGSRH